MMLLDLRIDWVQVTLFCAQTMRQSESRGAGRDALKKGSSIHEPRG
jgi:hypothetical protein